MLNSIAAPLVILTKSLVPLLATDARSRFDAAVATAGLLSYIGLVSYIWRPQRMTGKSVDCSWRGTAVAEGHFETADHSQQGIAARPPGRSIAGSSLVRRLVLAKDDPAKQRIRALLGDIDDEQLFCFGLTSEDIAALRGTAGPTAEANIAQRFDESSEDGGASQISPPIAAVLDETDDTRRHESTMPRRERVSRMLAG
jgi:hypothetical protein